MRTISRIMAAVLSVGAMLAFATTTQARTWVMDNYHSQAIFEIGHISGKVMGYFNVFEGTVTDPDDPRTGSIDITIDVASLDTGIDKRDAHLMTADFFDTAKYPKIRFRSERIEALGDGWFMAHGTLTIKDVSRPVALPYQVFEVLPNPMKEMACFDVQGIRAHYSLDRLQYNVGDGKFQKMGIVDDAVAITIHSELLSKRADCE